MSFDMFDILKSLRLPGPVGIIQVGASNGQEIDEFVGNGVNCGLYIEPLSEPFAKLSKRCRSIPDHVAVQTLCTDVTGQTYTFHVASNDGMSSSILPPENHLKLYGYVEFKEKLELKSTRLDDVMAFLAHNGYPQVVSRLDALYMDTQGSELMVLKGGVTTLRQTKYIFTEVTRNNLYRGAPSLPELMAFLDTHGFILNNIYYNREHCGDAFFIRKDVVGYAD